MSFKDQLKEDVAVFTNPNEFGDIATFSRNGSKVNIILDKDIDSETGRIIDVILVAKADVEGIQVNDTFTVGTTTYRNISSATQPMDEFICMIRVEND